MKHKSSRFQGKIERSLSKLSGLLALHAGKTKFPSQPEDISAGISSDFWRVGQPHGMMNGLARLFKFTESGVLSQGLPV